MVQDIAIVGAGILGLAHAWSAAERGHRVTVFESHERAQGASIRNFGMVWPIGQPPGPWHAIALASRRRWLTLAETAGLWVEPCGSIHLAHRSDEWAVLQEFAARGPSLSYDCALMTPDDVARLSPAVRRQGLLGGLQSTNELRVDARRTIRALPQWLSERLGVRFEFGTTVGLVEPADNGRVGLIADSRHTFDRVVVCGGIECGRLFPDVLAHADLRLCKLQMLKTRSQPGGWRLGPHLASGLTLRHYRNFEICPSLTALRERVAGEMPELDRFGIHVMVSQTEIGELILGDSHEYGAEAEPFDKPAIDELMLTELRKIVELPDWTIAERWHGFYAKRADAPIFEAEPAPGVHVCTGLGGSGMTMSFGLAEAAWNKWDGGEHESAA